MRIGIVSSLLVPKYGGPVSVVHSHVEFLRRLVQVIVCGVAPVEHIEEVKERLPEAWVYPMTFPSRWFRAKGLAGGLDHLATQVDLLHVHMLWDYPVVATWRAATRHGIPFVITPHGSVAQSWRYSSMHKKLYRALVLSRVLRDCAGIHALNEIEANGCRQFGIDCPVAVIPNGIGRVLYVSRVGQELAQAKWPILRNKRILLYLGRLWHEKGLDLLCKAWAEVVRRNLSNDWQLVLAGPDYRNYRATLEELVDSLGIRKEITIVGSVHGELKQSLLEMAECLILPSLGEGFSMTLLEAMASGTPAIYSTECNLPELAQIGAGWETPPVLEPLVDSLLNLLTHSRSTLEAMGARGNALGQDRYTGEFVASQLVEFYQKVIKAHARYGKH